MLSLLDIFSNLLLVELLFLLEISTNLVFEILYTLLLEKNKPRLNRDLKIRWNRK